MPSIAHAAIVAALWLAPTATIQAAGSVESEVGKVVDAFVAAQRSFDPAALARLTTPDYVEVSPVGDVDDREKMLGFYSPDKKRPAPEITINERSVRSGGGTAIMIARLTMQVPTPDGKTRPVSMRATFTLRRDGTAWKLAGAQYTPIRAG